VVKPVQEMVPEQVTVLVAIEETFAPPLDITSWPAVRLEEVLMPQYVRVEAVPPTKLPRVPAVEKGPETAYEEVATDWSGPLPLPAPYIREPEVKVVLPVPPYATAIEEVPTMVPAELV
jgi:hypothetical protein